MSAEEKLKLIERITALEDQKLLDSINHLINISEQNPARKSIQQLDTEIDASMQDSKLNNVISEKDLKTKIDSWS